MNAAHAYRVEATLPALLCSFENFSGFQITRISMSLRFIKMSVDRFRNPLANIHLFLIITTFSQKNHTIYLSTDILIKRALLTAKPL